MGFQQRLGRRKGWTGGDSWPREERDGAGEAGCWRLERKRMFVFIHYTLECFLDDG